ncbi:MAG: class I SAM-dependent methyltransferase [Candidatus Aminicenantes bacterium]|nr:class I SAM-dependent methyltransferase [Candidatus Aminicenantes bacterium]
MKKVENEFEVIQDIADFKDKIVIDVGCGPGDLVRKLSASGAQAIGIDNLEMLKKAKECPPIGHEKYIQGEGQNIPIENNYADFVIFFASLHHVPVDRMEQALKETHRILENNGSAIIVEPVGKKGSFYEIVRLVGDERKVQKEALKAINNARSFGLENIKEKEAIIYIERSYADYVKLLEIFLPDEKKRNEILLQAKEITTRLSRAAGISLENFRYKSICRLNILRKSP